MTTAELLLSAAETGTRPLEMDDAKTQVKHAAINVPAAEAGSKAGLGQHTAPSNSTACEQRRQIRTSSLALADSGYCLRSTDYPAKALWIQFDGTINVMDNELAADNSCLKQQQQQQDLSSKDVEMEISVLAVAGMFTLDLYTYILVVTESRCRGTIGGKSVYEIVSVAALPLDYYNGKAALQQLLGGGNAQKYRKSSLALQPLAPSNQQNNTAPGAELDRHSYTSAKKIVGDSTNSDSRLRSQSQSQQQPAMQKESDIGALQDASLGWLSPQLSKLLGRSRASTVSSSATASSASPSTASIGVDTLAATAQAKNAVNPENNNDSSLSAQRMEGRIIEELTRIFGSSGMFYSYDHDLTRSLQERGKQSVAIEKAPLSLFAAQDYWFNHNIQRQMLAADAHEWALPLIQGCVQIAICEIKDGDSFQVCVLSRRNWRRIGMRYERRGADAEGHVANFVETEQILTVEMGSQQTHHASFVQTRGSMPFYWKQPPAGLQPPPVVVKGDAENASVCALHLQREIDRLGRQVLVNLVEQKGREAVVGSKYASIVGQCVADEMVDACMIRYIPWDFHQETRGMRYETLQQLLEHMQREIADMGYYWCTGGQVFIEQRGVFRVNCMDCLDRTNVVQSTLARFVLNEQLVRLGVHVAPDQGLVAYSGLESTLNHLWANNGDYISKQYAGTSAMKGDFTRTGKRNFSGVMSDASYSLARLWISTFRDYFSQSVLDFTMGYQSAGDVFRTLIDLRSREPDHALQLTRTREAAIEASIATAVHDGENVQLACIVQSPMALDTLKLRGPSDAVLILTTAAVYICRYHYQMEKVSEVLRIDLSRLARVQYGAYITDTQVPQALDPARNHGLVLYFDAAGARFSSGSPQSKSGTVECEMPADDGDKPKANEHGHGHGLRVAGNSGAAAEQSSPPLAAEKQLSGDCGEHFIACKLVSEAQVVMQRVPGETSAAVGPSSANNAADLFLTRLGSLENQSPDLLAECLCSLMLSAALRANIIDSSRFIVDAPIISVATAKHSLSLVDKMSSRLHKALWL